MRTFVTSTSRPNVTHYRPVSSSIQNAAKSLYEWLRSKDFKGHDPHDLLESPFIPSLIKRSSYARLVLLQLGRRSPLDLHRLMKVPDAFNPKGGALILQGLLRGRAAIDPNWNEHATALGDRLLGTAIKTKNGLGWGYPFDWQSRTHFVPKHTPTIVSSSFVGEALLDLYDLTGSEQVIFTATRIADYITKDVSKRENKDGVSFGYSEGDKQIVFNASLLGAAFLARLGARLGEDSYLRLAVDAARFVAKHQEASGRWAYGAGTSQKWTDSFHTGYVLLSLRQIDEIMGRRQFAGATHRGYAFYRSSFFRKDGLPRYFANSDWPIDSHAAAHAILTLKEFGDHNAAQEIAHWLCGNMQNADGSFGYQRHERFTNKIPYIRWSNAWMFLALATLLETDHTT